MPSFDDVAAGQTALASHIQQVVDALSARRNTPLATTINDPLSYVYTMRNTDAASRLLQLFAADGTTVLLQVDGTGVKVSRDGSAAVAPLTSVGPGSSPTVAAGDHVHGSGGYSSSGTVSLESLFAASWISVGTNYTVGLAIMFVFCTAGITVTLPAAAATNRPITVAALSGSTTLASVAGAIVGGSVNVSTGVVMNGVISPGDSMTYKSDSTSWRGV